MTGYIKDRHGLMAKISAQIMRARKTGRITMEEMAERLGICRQAYSKREQYPEQMTLGELYMVMDLLNLRAEDLIK